ncbi:MAG TPA: sulfatase [Phycisphaerae bacterium]|nr:sulfatase [Phycisphaerae bacterium]
MRGCCHWLGFVLWTCVGWGLIGCEPEEPAVHFTCAEGQRPNVVLISVDTLRPDHLGCYGYRRDTSPNIDGLAAEGALFENTVSSTSWTLPAHAALFTGLVDTVHGCLDTNRPLSHTATTVAEVLRSAGYATAGFFSGPYLHPVFGLGQGFDVYVDCSSYPELNESEAARTGAADGAAVWRASHADVTGPNVYREVRSWLRSNRQTPFFLFVHLWDVHYDFVPPPPYDRMFDPDYTGSVTGRDFLMDASVNASMDRRDIEHLIALYDGEIAWTDLHVGKILADIDALGVRDCTAVVLLADHGIEFFEHGLKAHRHTLYDEVIRIPLIVRYPGRVTPGRRYATQVRMIDVAPTILDLCGLEVGSGMMGQRLTPLFAGQPLEEDNLAVAELVTNAGQLTSDGRWAAPDPRFPIRHRLQAFRRLDHKVIVDANRGQFQVFNLRTDPGERLAARSPASPAAQTALGDMARGRAWLESCRSSLSSAAPASEIPPKVREKLRSLGYINDDEQTDDR